MVDPLLVLLSDCLFFIAFCRQAKRMEVLASPKPLQQVGNNNQCFACM